MRQIVCISTTNYHPIPTRKQNVMNRLSDAEILYIDPPVSWIAPLKDKNARERLFKWKRPGERVKDNITVYAAPPVLPFFNKYRWINRINQRRQARFIRQKIREHGFDRPYIWCYSPNSCDCVDLLEKRGLIYDCVDRHSAYKGMITPAVVDKMEEELARKADMVFCTAEGLRETLEQYNENVKMIPNGAAYEIFSQVAAMGDKPVDPKKPVFGFVGMLQECIDYDCIRALAEKYPQGEVRLIGRTLPGVDVSALSKYPNVKFCGLVPQKELPEKIWDFDVCLNVFKEGRLSKDVSPLKFYEYLATGKPIVSTREPLQVSDFAHVVHVASGLEDFLKKCEEALCEEEPGRSQKAAERLEYGRKCSWDERVKQMEAILKEKQIFQ